MMLAFVYKEHFLNKLSSCHLDNFISFPLIYSCVCPMRINEVTNGKLKTPHKVNGYLNRELL